MTTVAYIYCDPLLDAPPGSEMWGESVSRVYQDLGDRHQLHQLLADCRASHQASGQAIGTDDETQGTIQTVLVHRLDELGDTVEEVGDRLHELASLGIVVQSLDNSLSPDQETSKGELLTLFRSIQKRQQAQRIRQGHARNRVKALPPPGKAPYGYRRGKDRYALDRSTAPVVKDFVEHFLLYGSLRGSVRYLAKKYNKKISVSTGQRWLTSPVYRGDLAYRNGDVVPDTHLAIISRDEAAQVDRLLRRNRKLPPRTASAPRSLAGLVKCGVCQSAMKVTRTTARGKSKEYMYLYPVACPHRSKDEDKASTGQDAQREHDTPAELPPCPAQHALAYDDVLSRAIDRICDELPRAVAGASLPDVDSLKYRIQTQLEEKQAILHQLPQLQESGVLDAETADLRAYTLRTEMADLRTTLDQLPPVNLRAIAQTVSIPQFWFDLSEAERRFYFREFIQQIQVVPAEPDASNTWQLKLIFMF